MNRAGCSLFDRVLRDMEGGWFFVLIHQRQFLNRRLTSKPKMRGDGHLIFLWLDFEFLQYFHVFFFLFIMNATVQHLTMIIIASFFHYPTQTIGFKVSTNCDHSNPQKPLSRSITQLDNMSPPMLVVMFSQRNIYNNYKPTMMM